MSKRRPDLLMIAASEYDSNMLWATHFVAGDPFIFMRLRGRTILVMSDLEIGRARDQARVDTILSFSTLDEKLKKAGVKKPTQIDILVHLLRRRRIRRLTVPWNFPLSTADALRKRGIRLKTKGDPFFEERVVKTRAEVEAVTRSLRHTEAAIAAGAEVLRRSRIRGSRVLYGGSPLTCERLKQVVNMTLMERGCVPSHTIIACGDHACDPHNEGSGPVRPNQAIIFDVFPRSESTMYYGDISRTFVKGRASEALRRQYDTVRRAQDVAFRRIRGGADGKKIHEEVEKFLKDEGYVTEARNGKMVGYFHGTGHGLGLDIHEAPGIGKRGTKLPAGAIVTVEPGLYYPGIGGVRIEDVVHVTERGCRNLVVAPKVLEIA